MPPTPCVPTSRVTRCSLDMPFHNNNTPGAMIERIDGDTQTLGGFFSTFAVHIVGNTIMLAAVLALLVPRGLAGWACAYGIRSHQRWQSSCGCVMSR